MHPEGSTPAFVALHRPGSLCILLLCILLTPGAWAQRRDPPAEIVGVRCGWNGIVPAERWSPVRVDVRAGEESFQGILALEHEQDSSQRVRIELPIATTPGRTTTYELAVCPRTNGRALRLTLLGRGVRQVIDLASSPGGDRFPSPEILPGARVVAVVGGSSAKAAFQALDLRSLEAASQSGAEAPRAANLWDTLLPATVPPGDLPLGWRCYDGVNAVVANASELAEADPRARAALMTWVEAGGRLALVVDAEAGDRWREFLGSGVVEVGAPGVFDPLGTWAGLGRTPLRARPIRLTETGLNDGWQVRWPVEAEGEAGLWASGPLGAGMVAVLGIDPERVPALVKREDTKTLWRAVLSHPQAGILPSHLQRAANDADGWGWYSGQDWPRARAITVALNAITPPVRAVGDAAFLAIAFLVVLLGCLLGPLDRRWLRARRWERWHWASALGWVLLTSLLAYAGPMMVRSGETHAARMCVVDVLDDGRVRASWTTALTGVFAGKPVAPEYKTTPGGWWRGVSALSPWEQAAPGGTPVSLRLFSGDVREARAARVAQGQWTFRTLMEESPLIVDSPDVPCVRVRRVPEGLSVEVDGLGAAATPSPAVVNLGNAVGKATLLPMDDARGRTVWAGRAGEWTAVSRSKGDDEAVFDGSAAWGLPSAPTESLLRLPGVRERSDAMDARPAGEGWAVVFVRVDGAKDEHVPRVEGAVERSVMLLRAVVRVEGKE